jgi:hypothetical protein
MKFNQKIKYSFFGIIISLVVVPVGIWAYDAVSVSFRKGDVISASVLNHALQNLNNVVSGYKSSDEIVGVWSCKMYIGTSSCQTMSNLSATGDGVTSSATQNITFSCSGGTCTGYAQSFVPWTCNPSVPNPYTFTYSLMGNAMANSGTGGLFQQIQKVSPTSFIWTNSSTVNVCSLNSAPPGPVNNLSLTYSSSGATTQVNLTWSDSNADQSGFIVNRSDDGGTTWTTVGTISNASSMFFTDNVASGSYQYQVFATNTNGTSSGSSVVAVSF